MQGRVTSEIEFEFVEGTEGGDFVVTDQVRSVIMGHLAGGRIDQAASLIATSVPELGDALLEQDAAEASRALRESLAEAFVRARDFERAGRAALLIGDPGRAAPFFERSYQFDRAAELYERAGKLVRAAELYERGLQHAKAAGLYESAKQPERAAEAWEKAGDGYRSGKLWAQLKRFDRAVEVLQRVGSKEEAFGRATWLLGAILERTGHRPAAVARYIQMVKALPVGPNTVDVYERLAEIYLSAGEHKAVQTLLSRVLLFDPNREKAQRLMAAAGDQVPTLASAPVAAPPTSDQAVGPVPVYLPGGQSAQPSGQSAGASSASEQAAGPAPLRLPGGRGATPSKQASAPAIRPLVLPRAGAAGAESPGRVTITVMKKAVDRLRQLPLFAELSLGELRALEALGEQCELAAGTVLIEQGQEGSHLFVVLSGKVSVAHIGARGETLLAELGQGAAVGEMALVDEGPTSARVLVVEDAVVYRWPMNRLRRHFAANEGTAHRILRVISRTLSVRLRETNRRAAGED